MYVRTRAAKGFRKGVLLSFRAKQPLDYFLTKRPPQVRMRRGTCHYAPAIGMVLPQVSLCRFSIRVVVHVMEGLLA